MNGTSEQIQEVWRSHQGSDLRQGDFLTACLVPIFPPTLSPDVADYSVSVGNANLIVVTQSCDLANRKVEFAAMCPIFTLEQMEGQSPQFTQKGAWEDVRRGRREGLHMLPGTDSPENNRDALVIDFRQIFSLPIGYLSKHAKQLGNRWRLQSPFLEHFSQAFARFFMRVGLPSAIPPFK